MSNPPPDLVREWYARAEAGGFRDIETQDSPDVSFGWKTGSGDAGQSEYFDAARDYFRRRGPTFAPRDRRIARLHCDGLTIREIAAQVGVGRHAVELAVGRFKRRMGRALASTPTKSARGKDSVRIHVRLSDAEAELLQSMSKRVGRTPAHTLRLLLIAGGANTSNRNEMAAIIAEIAAAER